MTREELRTFRRELSAAQIDVAGAIGVSEYTVQSWEVGRHAMPAALNFAWYASEIAERARRRKARSARNRSRGLLAWMRQNPALVAARNRAGARKLTREDRRELGKLTWAGTTHAERSKLASARQRRRWAKIPKRARSEYMRRITLAHWRKLPASVRSKLISEMQKRVWARRSRAERSRINSARVRKGWEKMPKRERSALMYERFWTWFPLLDRESQGRVLAALRRGAAAQRK